MEKVDFKQLFKSYYSPRVDEPQILTIPRMYYLMLDGSGNPNNSVVFQSAIGALYGIIFTIKFSRKKAGIGPDFSIGPLQTLWWMKGNRPFNATKKEEWLWTMLLWVPDFIGRKDLENAVTQLVKKKPNPFYCQVRLEVFDEGKVAQIMHMGPYSAEGPTIEKLHHYAKDQGFTLHGKHHEIYLGDPRRAKPEKLRTIIRQPVHS